MGIGAIGTVNSWLSTTPMGAYSPIAPIRRDGFTIDSPEQVKPPARPLLRPRDTMGPAIPRDTARPAKPKISEQEVRELLQLIKLQSFQNEQLLKRDHPALIKV